MDKFIEKNSDKDLFLCWKNATVKPLFDIFDCCVRYNKILVIFSPKVKEYSDDLKYMIDTDFRMVRIYECSSYGMRSIFKKRIRDYQKQFKNSIAIPEELFLLDITITKEKNNDLSQFLLDF